MNLTVQDPTNAEWQHDLAVTLYKLAQFSQKTEDQTGAADYLRRCHAALQGMRQHGMSPDPPLAQLLEQLDTAF